jgi:NAD(P)-dependent dehydrogenase (short-subunit alcohol dehydrogenase family)
MKKNNKFRLDDKITFVLGGLGLLGSSISKLFLDYGSKVIILDINKKYFNKFINKYMISSANIFFENFDCTKLSLLETKLAKIVDKYECPSVFVNSSYPFTKSWGKNDFDNIKLKYYLENLNSQLNSNIWMTHLIAKTMVNFNQKGSIIQISSIYGNLGQDLNIYKNTYMRENLTYSVIKGGINNFTRQLASFYGQNGIRVNNIIAGGIKGPVAGISSEQDKKFINNYSRKTLLKRLGAPEDISNAALFLASEASSYITGSDLYVDGGWSAV